MSQEETKIATLKNLSWTELKRNQDKPHFKKTPAKKKDSTPKKNTKKDFGDHEKTNSRKKSKSKSKSQKKIKKHKEKTKTQAKPKPNKESVTKLNTLKEKRKKEDNNFGRGLFIEKTKKTPSQNTDQNEKQNSSIHLNVSHKITRSSIKSLPSLYESMGDFSFALSRSQEDENLDLTKFQDIHQENFINQELELILIIQRLFASKSADINILIINSKGYHLPGVIQLQANDFRIIIFGVQKMVMKYVHPPKMKILLSTESKSVLKLQLNDEFSIMIKTMNDSDRFILWKIFLMFQWYTGDYVEGYPISGKILGEEIEIYSIVLRCLTNNYALFQVYIVDQDNKKHPSILKLDKNHLSIISESETPVVLKWEKNMIEIVLDDKRKRLIKLHVAGTVSGYSIYIVCQSSLSRKIIYECLKSFNKMSMNLHENLKNLYSLSKKSEFHTLFEIPEEDQLGIFVPTDSKISFGQNLIPKNIQSKKENYFENSYKQSDHLLKCLFDRYGRSYGLQHQSLSPLAVGNYMFSSYVTFEPNERNKPINKRIRDILQKKIAVFDVRLNYIQKKKQTKKKYQHGTISLTYSKIVIKTDNFKKEFEYNKRLQKIYLHSRVLTFLMLEINEDEKILIVSKSRFERDVFTNTFLVFLQENYNDFMRRNMVTHLSPNTMLSAISKRGCSLLEDEFSSSFDVVRDSKFQYSEDTSNIQFSSKITSSSYYTSSAGKPIESVAEQLEDVSITSYRASLFDSFGKYRSIVTITLYFDHFEVDFGERILKRVYTLFSRLFIFNNKSAFVHFNIDEYDFILMKFETYEERCGFTLDFNAKRRLNVHLGKSSIFKCWINSKLCEIVIRGDCFLVRETHDELFENSLLSKVNTSEDFMSNRGNEEKYFICEYTIKTDIEYMKEQQNKVKIHVGSHSYLELLVQSEKECDKLISVFNENRERFINQGACETLNKFGVKILNTINSIPEGAEIDVTLDKVILTTSRPIENILENPIYLNNNYLKNNRIEEVDIQNSGNNFNGETESPDTSKIKNTNDFFKKELKINLFDQNTENSTKNYSRKGKKRAIDNDGDDDDDNDTFNDEIVKKKPKNFFFSNKKKSYLNKKFQGLVNYSSASSVKKKQKTKNQKKKLRRAHSIDSNYIPKIFSKEINLKSAKTRSERVFKLSKFKIDLDPKNAKFCTIEFFNDKTLVLSFKTADACELFISSLHVFDWKEDGSIYHGAKSFNIVLYALNTSSTSNSTSSNTLTNNSNNSIGNDNVNGNGNDYGSGSDSGNDDSNTKNNLISTNSSKKNDVNQKNNLKSPRSNSFDDIKSKPPKVESISEGKEGCMIISYQYVTLTAKGEFKKSLITKTRLFAHPTDHRKLRILLEDQSHYLIEFERKSRGQTFIKRFRTMKRRFYSENGSQFLTKYQVILLDRKKNEIGEANLILTSKQITIESTNKTICQKLNQNTKIILHPTYLKVAKIMFPNIDPQIIRFSSQNERDKFGSESKQFLELLQIDIIKKEIPKKFRLAFLKHKCKTGNQGSISFTNEGCFIKQDKKNPGVFVPFSPVSKFIQLKKNFLAKFVLTNKINYTLKFENKEQTNQFLEHFNKRAWHGETRFVLFMQEKKLLKKSIIARFYLESLHITYKNSLEYKTFPIGKLKLTQNTQNGKILKVEYDSSSFNLIFPSSEEREQFLSEWKKKKKSFEEY
ncbi:cell wall integrity/stress response component-like protein [Anaeramoeba flamelloides]|uniref:Cell wall integrity/stress response component-like protein n=1 Tax=Anaeramoeba flamelloides TaxID=1746091 RepID=A0ABQ8XV71_9EUKA|nr:cell wall integrity/stress response component-like protein [Anaeramoeba flamelloides]